MLPLPSYLKYVMALFPDYVTRGSCVSQLLDDYDSSTQCLR